MIYTISLFTHFLCEGIHQRTAFKLLNKNKMVLFKSVLLLLINVISLSAGENTVSTELHNEIDTARCRSSCILSHNKKQSANLKACRSIKTDHNDHTENINQDAECVEDMECSSDTECSKCWSTCKELSNGKHQTWSDICEPKNDENCGKGCKVACRMLKNNY